MQRHSEIENEREKRRLQIIHLSIASNKSSSSSISSRSMSCNWPWSSALRKHDSETENHGDDQYLDRMKFKKSKRNEEEEVYGSVTYLSVAIIFVSEEDSGAEFVSSESEREKKREIEIEIWNVMDRVRKWIWRAGIRIDY